MQVAGCAASKVPAGEKAARRTANCWLSCWCADRDDGLPFGCDGNLASELSRHPSKAHNPMRELLGATTGYRARSSITVPPFSLSPLKTDNEKELSLSRRLSESTGREQIKLISHSPLLHIANFFINGPHSIS
ncbi:hypothetical protein NDU88_001519 [Pleurodeles waltl]|uniref:Uncharacterized protein n=1 Tax=Pleurodeles waltl TaxID=8319 RepID=A0AAV7LA07_PLEWA|nr:hypothetical protein NDU88_001519 [Pleurodeles waltl]